MKRLMKGKGSFEDGSQFATSNPQYDRVPGSQPRTSLSQMTHEQKWNDSEWRRLRRLLVAFYEKHDPSKLEAGIDNVVDIGLQYGLPALSESLIKKYGEDLTDQLGMENDLLRGSIKKKLTDFYSKHDPSWVLVSTMVSAGLVDNGPIEDLVEWGFHHGYDRLNAKLIKKYGEGLVDLAVPIRPEIEEETLGLTRPMYTDTGMNQTMNSQMTDNSGASGGGVRRVRYNGGDQESQASSAPKRKPKHKLKLPASPSANDFSNIAPPPGLPVANSSFGDEDDFEDEYEEPMFEIKRKPSKDNLRKSLTRAVSKVRRSFNKKKDKKEKKERKEKPARKQPRNQEYTQPKPVNRVQYSDSEACDYFKMDLSATGYNICFCGHPKTEHAGYEDNRSVFGSFSEIKLRSTTDVHNDNKEQKKEKKNPTRKESAKPKLKRPVKPKIPDNLSVMSTQSEVGSFLQGFNLASIESALSKLGVERLDDLGYLEEEDASALDLKPIQMRKLMKAVQQLRRQSHAVLTNRY